MPPGRKPKLPFYMMPLDYPNSAGRLHRLLSTAISLGAKRSGPIIDLWEVVLGIEDDYEYEHRALMVFQRLGKFYEVTIELEKEIQTHVNGTDKRNLYLTLIPRIRTLLSLASGDLNVPQFLAKLDPSLLMLLAVCAVDLPRERPISGDDLKTLNQMFGDLFSKIEKVDLHADLKKWLLSLLADAQRSIAEYQIRGAETFGVALKAMFGEICLHQQLFNEVRTSHKDIWTRWDAIVKRFGEFARAAESCGHLLGPGTHLLLNHLPNIAG